MNILERIVQNKKQELESNKSDGEEFQEIFSEKRASIIGEIKLASPKYDYSEEINLEKIFRYYGENKKIKAISNLIDEKYFKGEIRRGTDFKKKYNKPIFFKEFVISKTQIDGAAYYGYDAVLLLARVLSRGELIDFIFYAQSKNVFPIVEVDCDEDMKIVVKLSKELDFGIAINCRNLGTMEIERKKHFSIIKSYEKELENILVFAFSGIDNLEQVEEYKGKFNGVLVGSYFMNKLKSNA